MRFSKSSYVHFKTICNFLNQLLNELISFKDSINSAKSYNNDVIINAYYDVAIMTSCHYPADHREKTIFTCTLNCVYFLIYTAFFQYFFFQYQVYLSKIFVMITSKIYIFYFIIETLLIS